MKTSADDDGVFIRSLACRGEFGGLSAEVWPMSLVMLAACDVVMVETVGVGQRRSISRACATRPALSRSPGPATASSS